MALDNRGDKQVLLCKSDDLLIECDCNYKRGCGVPYCFVKQETKNMLSDKCAKLYNLHRWKQVGKGCYTEALARATIKLHALRDLVNFDLC